MAIGAVTLIIRFVLVFHSFDLFEDEVIYTNIGRSVVSGGWPRFDGNAFFLHGPGFFYLESAWSHVFGNPPGLMPWVSEMRMLNLLLAGATAVVLVLLVTRASSMRAGIVAGLLFSLDPFCIRQNDRVMLETATILWVMLGYLVFTSLIVRPPSRRDWLRAVGAGLLFGCAVLTKDEGALLTVLPLLAAVVLRWGPRRTMTMVTLVTIGTVYAVYIAVVVADGQFANLWAGKTSGLQRMLGIVQASGFHSSGGGSLSTRLIVEVGYFGTTYTILALALPMVIVLLRRGRSQLHRILALLYFAAGVTLAYALALGTLEEQELYLLAVPSLVIITVGIALLRDDNRSRSRSKSLPRNRRGALGSGLITGATALALTVNVATCVQWVLQPDDAVIRLLQYITVNVPADTAIADLTAAPGEHEDVVQYALGDNYHLSQWLTLASQTRSHAQYVLVMWGLINKAYSNVSSSEAQQAVSHDREVFSASGRSDGQIALYIRPSRLCGRRAVRGSGNSVTRNHDCRSRE